MPKEIGSPFINSRFDFRNQLSDINQQTITPPSQDQTSATLAPLKYQEYLKNLTLPAFHPVRYNLSQLSEYLEKQRCLSMETLSKYQIGAAEYRFVKEKDKWVPNLCVTFPFVFNTEVLRVKVRSILEKANQRFDPPGGRPSLFGLHLIRPTDTEVVLTGFSF